MFPFRLRRIGTRMKSSGTRWKAVHVFAQQCEHMGKKQEECSLLSGGLGVLLPGLSQLRKGPTLVLSTFVHQLRSSDHILVEGELT